MIPDQDKAYYESLLDLFVHPGWLEFIADINSQYEMANLRTSIDKLKTLEDLHQFHGKNQAFQKILEYEATVRSALDILERAEAETEDYDFV